MLWEVGRDVQQGSLSSALIIVKIIVKSLSLEGNLGLSN